MGDYGKKYYEQSAFWDKNYLEIPEEKERIEETIKVIPPDTHSVLDVGCGNGCFVNTLVSIFPNRFDRVIGLDLSDEALKHVKTEKLNGNITDLLFEDESFDLVTSLEVLEHLPQEDFKRGVSELQRVSKKYVIITVPNNENLADSLVRCPKCYCWFSAWSHMRSFNKDTFQSLFENFKLIEAKEIGRVERLAFNRMLLILYRFFRKPVPPETAICPQCGYQNNGKSKNLKNNKNSIDFRSSILSLFKRLFKIILPGKKRRRWLLALYKKADRQI